jgi:mannonate dehydratase
MRLGLKAHELDDDLLKFARQLGVDCFVLHRPRTRGDGYFDFQTLAQFRTRVESWGLKLEAIESMPQHFWDQIQGGGPQRDEQIENARRSIRNMGRAGIPIFGYSWQPLLVARTGNNPVGRGGATVSMYDHALGKRAPLSELGPMSDAQQWERLTYFLEAVIPVAEEEGVTLALHPDDPPVPDTAGVARIIRSVEALKRALDIVPSPNNCLEFCQGTVAEMCSSAEEVYEAIRYFGSRDKIAYVHFRNVSSGVPAFQETFIDDGYVDMLQAMRAYHDVGFDGVLTPDHVPGMVGDTRWGHRGRAYSVGYIKALIKAVDFYEGE